MEWGGEIKKHRECRIQRKKGQNRGKAEDPVTSELLAVTRKWPHALGDEEQGFWLSEIWIQMWLCPPSGLEWELPSYFTSLSTCPHVQKRNDYNCPAGMSWGWNYFSPYSLTPLTVLNSFLTWETILSYWVWNQGLYPKTFQKVLHQCVGGEGDLISQKFALDIYRLQFLWY